MCSQGNCTAKYKFLELSFWEGPVMFDDFALVGALAVDRQTKIFWQAGRFV